MGLLKTEEILPRGYGRVKITVDYRLIPANVVKFSDSLRVQLNAAGFPGRCDFRSVEYEHLFL
jgi:hypothetical protein